MIEFLSEILTFITSGIYDFCVEAYAWIIIKVTVYKVEGMLFAMKYSWEVAREIMTQLNISQEITSALSALPPETIDHLNFFNVINGINLMLNAFITRFVMRFTGL